MKPLSQKNEPGLLLAQVYSDLKNRLRPKQKSDMSMLLLRGLLLIIVVETVFLCIQMVAQNFSFFTDLLLVCALLALVFIVSLNLVLRVATPSRPQGVNVAELLEREVIPLDSTEVYSVLRDRVVLVTGAAGSIGSELCRQVLDYGPACLIALDSNETGLFDLAESLRGHPYAQHLCVQIDDIVDSKSMQQLFERQRPQVVFHAAAYKHVPLLERFPAHAVRTNALGTYHLCRLAQRYAVERFVFISTDKAAAPTSVMGMSKRVGEMVVQSLAAQPECATCFCAVRFGNVLGSRGSVVPIFKQQIEQGGPLTVTHPEATRYFMTIPEACGLVILTAAIALRGGLYMLDMGQPVRILDVARKMIRQHGLREGKDIQIVYTGLRAGEHMHEVLTSTQEALLPTTHNKIFCVQSDDALPVFGDMEHWMNYIEDNLPLFDEAELRAFLFGLVQRQEMIGSMQR